MKAKVKETCKALEKLQDIIFSREQVCFFLIYNRKIITKCYKLPLDVVVGVSSSSAVTGSSSTKNSIFSDLK